MKRLICHRRVIAVISCLAALAVVGIANGGLSWATTRTEPAVHSHDHGAPSTAMPANDPARGLRYDGLRRGGPGHCKGMFEMTTTPGACTHGPDVASHGKDVKRPVPPIPARTANATPGAATAPSASSQSIVCDGNGVNGYRVEVLYVHGADQPDRYNEYLSSIRSWASGVDDIYHTSAAKTGGVRHIRFVTNSDCQMTVHDVSIPDSDLNYFDRSTWALQARGYNRKDRKYLMFVDATALCGMSFFWADSGPGQYNANNFGRVYSRVDSGCWDTRAAAHELTHSMGAVMGDSPNTTTNGHCADKYDVMCYDDGGTPVQFACPDLSDDNVLDCNNDDYFNTNPPAGSYLATHWNIANSQFLIGGGSIRPDGTAGPIVGPGGKCLDVYQAKTDNDTPAIIWDCHGGANQSWTVGSDGTLRSLGMCLEVPGDATANGTNVVVRDCNGDDKQVWRVSGSSLINQRASRCLDLPDDNTTSGIKLQIWDCDGSAAQKWRLPS